MQDDGPISLRTMSGTSIAALQEDVERYGKQCERMSLREMWALPISSKRVQRLKAWLSRHGAVPPGPDGRPAQPEPEPQPATGRSGDRGRRHLIFGDTHATPGASHARFVWAGRMVADLLEPDDLVVQVGDFRDFASLNKHATALERAPTRIRLDIEAGQEALDAWERGMGGSPRSSGAPKHVVTLGNHDHYLDRLSEEDPRFEGLLSAAADHTERGWMACPFLEPYDADGVRYVHYMRYPGASRAIGGEYAPQHILRHSAYQHSVVVGHSHRLQMATVGLEGGRRRWAIAAGCYHEHRPDYAGAAADNWWRGAILLHDVADGDFRIELFPMGEIRKRWGG